MEPSGQMDSGTRVLSKTQSEIWDIADEEVHFSRDAVTKHHHGYHQPSSSGHQMSAPPNNQHQPSTQDYISILTTSPGSATRHDSLSDVSLHNYQPVFGNEAQDQAKSTRILHSIGSRLRRGSNYLAAPKLVGQYLLGITIQNWSEFLNTSRMMKAPSTTNQLTRRLVANLSHFQGNYLCVSLVLVVYCILTSPLLLLAIAAYLFALYVVTARSATGRQLTLIGGFRPNLHQQYSFITLISLPLLWVAGAPSAVFWVIGASFVVVGLHASMYSSEKGLAELNADHNHLQQHQLNSGSLKVPSTVQYYNHYPATMHQRQYLPIPSELTAPIQVGTAVPQRAPTYANSLTQWMLFGSASKGDKATPLPTVKAPEVTIISQHYAGLGRVYEV